MTTHVYDSRLRFQVDVKKQVCNEFKADEVAEWQKYVGLVSDEMKVKEGIVYNKNSREIIGYVNLGEVTNQLLEFERKCASELNDDHNFLPITKYISCFMVRGIFQHVNFPCAQFATTDTSSDEISPPVCEAIKRLELIGLDIL